MTLISGFERSQLLLLPETVDDYVGADNPVRFIDASMNSTGKCAPRSPASSESSATPSRCAHERGSPRFAPALCHARLLVAGTPVRGFVLVPVFFHLQR